MPAAPSRGSLPPANTALPRAAKDHFLTLDGLRGVAATAVVAHHAHKMLWPGIESAHPWLAVDFFFCLSGFVIAHAYATRLSQDMRFGTFVEVRLRRLGPLFLLGMTLGLLVNLLQVGFGAGEHRQEAREAMAGIVGFLGLPAPPIFGPDREFFPLNGPAWSLMFECLANVAIALVWRSGVGSTGRLVAWLAAFLVAMLAIAFSWHSLEWGWNWSSSIAGVVRIGWSFPLGVLLYWLHAAGCLKRLSVPAPLLFLATLALLVTPTPPGFGPAFECLAAIIAFPAIVFLGATARSGRLLRPVEQWLGATSYALYITHYPLFLLYGSLFPRLMHAPADSMAPWAGLGFLVLASVFAWTAYRFYDVPVRRWLASAGPAHGVSAKQSRMGLDAAAG